MASRRFRNAVDFVVYVVVRLLVAIVESLRIETCATWSRRLAVLLADIVPIRRAVVDDNLSHAFPEMSEPERHALRRRMWEHLFLMVVEVIHAPRKIHDTNWRDYVTLYRADEIIKAVFDDRPALLICGHYGNFELSAYALGLLGFPTFTIARTLDNRYLDQYLNDFRGVTGQYILPKSGSSSQVDQVLSRGGILALLGDQHAGPKGCWVDFFGRSASSHKGIALFALSSEAPTVFCYTRRLGKPLSLLMSTHGTLDPRTLAADMRTVPAITQWYTGLLERTIREEPEQYWWVHRRWKDTRSKKPSVAHDRAA